MMMGMMSPPVPPEHREGDRHAWAMLQRARPKVDWNRSTVRRADMTGDGKLARVMMGQDDDGHVWVGIARPDLREGLRNPHVLDIGPVDTITLAFHKLESVEQCMIGPDQRLEGCRPRKGQRGLTITVPDAPVQRLYWNANIREFAIYVVP